MTDSTKNAIVQIGGFSQQSPAARFFAQRPVIAEYAQGSFESLLEPVDLVGISQKERELVGLRVGILTPDPRLAEWHRVRLRSLGVSTEIISAAENFPEVVGLSDRDIAILRHTDLLISAPHEAEEVHIEALREVGLTARDIVTLSQLIAFLSFQVRVLAAARLFSEVM